MQDTAVSKVLAQGQVSETSLLPRTIEFVCSARSDTLHSAAATKADTERDATVPAYYLFPRHKLSALFEAHVPQRVGRGLQNAGNTCFFNSVLQTLTYTLPLQNYLLSKEHTSACQVRKTGGFCSLCLLEQHVHEALQGGSKPLHPRALLRGLKEFGGRLMQLGRQQDAHEFLINFLDSCHRLSLRAVQDRSPPPAVQHTTLIRQLFGGYLRSQVECSRCGNESNTFDPYLDLSVDVHSVATLEGALGHFTRTEQLAGPNLYRCRYCKDQVNATRQLLLHSVPPLLTLQLKRFGYSNGLRGKIVKPIAFGKTIDLARFTTNPKQELLYGLYAMIIHSGPTAKSGHYFAFVRHETGIWYCFDDENVRAVSEQAVLRQQAYLLFYEAKQSPLPPRPEAAEAAPSAPGPDSVKPSNSSGAAGPPNGVGAGTAGPPSGVGVGGSASSEGADRKLNGRAAADSPPPRLAAVEGREARRAEPLTLSAGPAAPAGDAAGCGACPARARSQCRPSRTRKLQKLHTLGRQAKRRRANGVSGQAPAAHIEDSCEAKRRRANGVSGQAPVAHIEDMPRICGEPRAAVEQTADERSRLTSDYNRQFGLADVNQWEDAEEPERESFASAQRALQPPVARRDTLDAEYDAGKRKHKARKPKGAFSGKSVFDEEERRRQRRNGHWQRRARKP